MAKTEVAEFFKQTSWDFVADVESGVINRAISRSKYVELLHKQLLRKSRVRDNNKLDFGVIGEWGRCYAVKSYDIKSGSTRPYNYNSKDDLGLNQFFVGQNPYKPYNGDPKKGIYHDSVNIILKFHTISGYVNYENEAKARTIECGYYDIHITPIYSENDSGAGTYFTGKSKVTYKIRRDKIEARWGKIIKYVKKKFNNSNNFLLDGEGYYICESGFAIEIAYPKGSASDKSVDKAGSYWIIPLFSYEHNMPVSGAGKWLGLWSEIYDLAIQEDNDIEIFIPVIYLAMVVITYFSAGATSGAWSALASGTATLTQVGAISSFIAVIGLNLTIVGTLTGNKGLVKTGRVLGFIGAIGSIYTAAKEFFFQGTAKAGASALPNSTIAGMQGMGQTSSLYVGMGTNGFANATYTAGATAGATAGTSASSTGLSVGVSNTSSVMYSSSENAFRSALAGYNVGATGANATALSTSQLYFTQAINAIKIGYKGYSLVQNIRGAFREANTFNDEDMQEQSDEEKAVGVNSEPYEDENGIARRFYERDVEYDLGLEGGTLMSNDDSLLQ